MVPKVHTVSVLVVCHYLSKPNILTVSIPSLKVTNEVLVQPVCRNTLCWSLIDEIWLDLCQV